MYIHIYIYICMYICVYVFSLTGNVFQMCFPLRCVQEAIKAFCVEEKLDGTDAWRCPRPMDKIQKSRGVSDQQVEIEVF